MWRAYFERRGSLFIGRRIEQAIGDLMALYHNGKVKEEDYRDPVLFMPHEDKPEEIEISLDDAMANGFG
ncbi:hypothetical protein EAH57_15630 [Acinetobacter sp. 2JN-4]|uniref:hypothetical protein n=1 Tax=Acinetobacter sp. 2JN-4 TaxID=2479844 RepID=UPI000EF9DB43|nr:hypothetical protein [Acinetobacter sp. 2JN-4]RLZ06570.1 hypothetical protein EAH57_15630 [Acinetobacter sp. 2JN-4]